MMKNYNRVPMKLFVISAVISTVSMSLSSCSADNTDAIKIEKETTIENLYTLSKTQFESSEMQLGELEMKDFHEVVKANGMFDVPPENRASVSSYFGGTVKSLKLLVGEEVKKGQTLFVLENPEFVQMQQDFLEAKAQLTYLKSDYERQKNLAQENIASQKNFLKAESEYLVTKVKVESLSKKLALLNIDPSALTFDNIQPAISIPAPIDGFITLINISRGSFLNPSETAINLVNTDHLHIELNIFEKDLSKIKVGQTIRFKIQEDNSREYDATVHLVNKTIDPQNRTIGIHGHLSDESQTSFFTPGMYVESVIYTTSQSRASLPQNAVVESENKFFVLVLEQGSSEEFVFTKKEVKIGVSNKGTVEILNASDFHSGDKFLVKGAFNLITE